MMAAATLRSQSPQQFEGSRLAGSADEHDRGADLVAGVHEMNIHKMSLRAKVGIVLALVLVGLIAARFAWSIGQRRDLDTVGAPDNPFVLLLSPTYDAAAERLAALSTLVSDAAGFAVSVRRANDAEAAIIAAGTTRADGWLLPVFDYLFCQHEYRAEAGLQVLREGGARTYHGEIFVRSDSGITAPSGLSGRRVAFVDAYSTSGFLYPARLLVDAQATVVPVFAGSHGATLEAVKSGQADAAATYAQAPPPGLRVVARTAEIPNEPVFFRPGVSSDLRRRFSDALVQVAAGPRGRELLGALGGITGFAPATDGDYAGVRREIEAASKELQDLVPGGWGIYNATRRPALTP